MDWPEVAIGRYTDEPYWTVDTNCKIYKELLVRRGWQPYAYERPYWRFRLPKKALTIRSKAAVERQLSPQELERNRRALEAARRRR
jgi:hypothetical protein